MSQSLTSDISSILSGKNAIINQLEEKLIESHNKIEEISEDMQDEIQKGAALRPQLDAALKENMYLKDQLDLLENALMDLQKKMDTDEKEKMVLKKQVEEQQREGKALLSKLEDEHIDNSNLQEENSDLKNMMVNLNDQLQGHRTDVNQLVEKALEEKEGIYKQKLSEISTSLTSGRSLVSMVNSLLSQIMDTQKKDYSHVLASAISSAADLESCLSTAQSVIEGLPPLTKTEALEQSMSAKEQAEIASIKLQLTEAIKENKNLHREFNDAYSDLSRLEAENKNLRERVELLEDDYNHKLNELSGKIDELMSKLHSTGGESGGDGSRHHNSSSPQNFESQLEDLEKRIHHVGSVMKSQQMQSKVLNRQLLHSCGEDDASNLSEDSESESSEELSDEEFDSEFDDIGDDDNAKIISSLRHMSSQVSSTNSRLHDVTQNLSKSSTGSSSSPKKAGLQQRLHSCEQKVCHLTNRLSMENEFADITEGKTVDEIKLAFYGCLSCVQSKLIAVNEEVRAIESAGTKQQANKLTPKIKDKLCYLIRYIKHMQNLTEEDWYILGRLQVKKTSVERHLHNRLEHTKPDEPGKADEQILQYAEKLALEVVILGELAYLLQNNYLANRCVDSLWKEINEVNQLFLQVQEKVMKDLEECRVDNDSELLSNYVKMLSQKIVVEGHLISSLGIGKAVLADQAEKSEDLSDLPCLATEAISRTLACEYMEHQFHYLGDQLEKFSGHFTAQALLQGEMTYALINLKEKIDQQMVGESKEFIKEEAKTAFVKLKEQENACYEIVQKYKEQKLLKIQDIIKCSSGKQNVILVVSQVHRLLQTHIKQYEDMLEPSLPTSKKCQIIHDSLKVEQDSFLKTMQVTLQENEELECYEKEFMDNIKSHLMELADVLVLNATIRGQVTYITELYGTKFGTSPPTSIQDLDADSSISDDERRWENLMKKLGSVLTGEAKIKSQAAFQLVDQCIDIDQGRIQEIKELLLCLPSVQGYCPHRLTNYSNQVIREAVFQAQMCYLMEKLRLEYEEEINQLRILNSSPNMRGFQSQDNRECEVDVQGMMQVFETVFEQKYKDELSVFSALEKEIDSLKYAAATEGTNCNECIWAKELIDNLEMVFNEQYSKAKNKHEVNTDSFNKEMTSVSSKVTKVIEERDREKETLVSFYEDRISLMQEEFDCLTVERDEELAQVKMDIMTAVGAIQASEHQTEAQRCEQVKQLTRNIAMQKYYFNVLIDEVKQRISDPKLMQKIDRFQQNLQLPSNENLKDENDDQAEKFLSANSSFELSKDDTSTAGDGDKHEQQMAQLKKEKDDALAQEAKLTKAALESMSKAYEDNLETEKNRFRDALKTMYTEDYVNEIRRHHELEVGKLQEELKSLNLHYTSKCEDYKMLEERLSRSKTEQNEHMTTLLARNEQLTTLVEEELTELKELVKKRSPRGLPAGSSSLEEDLYEAQIMNRMKDSDIQKLRSQVTAGDVNLNRITEEHKQVMTQYLHCKKLYSALQEENIGLKSKLEKAIGETKPDQNSLQRRQQPVRRVPSFHHRARSPSPGHPSSQRKEEHISRDSHKGRRYQLKDIRRSRSSPSLPFVFGSKQLLGEKTLLVSKDSMSGMSSTCRR